MPDIKRAHILIIATNGFEQSELEVPRDKLRQAGAKVDIATLDGNDIRGWDENDWGRRVKADLRIGDAKVENYDALVIPGGVLNPDKLRVDQAAMMVVKLSSRAARQWPPSATDRGCSCRPMRCAGAMRHLTSPSVRIWRMPELCGSTGMSWPMVALSPAAILATCRLLRLRSSRKYRKAATSTVTPPNSGRNVAGIGWFPSRSWRPPHGPSRTTKKSRYEKGVAREAASPCGGQ